MPSNRRRRRSNLLIRYSLLILSAIAVIAFSLQAVLSFLIQDHLVRMHGALYGDVARALVSPTAFAGSVPEGSTEIEKLGSLARFPHMKAFALWNRDGALVYQLGTVEPLVARATASFIASFAKDGRVRYEYAAGRPKVFGAPGPLDLILFLPIAAEGGGSGAVAGIREMDEGLQVDLVRVRSYIAISVGLAGLALYVVLFGLYFGSYREQRTIADHLRQTHDIIIFAMSSLSRLRDQETGGHLERTGMYVRLIALELGGERTLGGYLDRDYIDTLSSVAPLHDIGKVGIDDAILRKPGKLTPEEFEEMKRHCVLGSDILRDARKKIPFQSSLELAEQITRHHHERWDGRGYPDALAGDRIPLSARIMALADVYDALRSERCYKKGFSHEEASAIVMKESGAQFDPMVIRAFQATEFDFRQVYEIIKGET